jgi:hypothetical protein
MSFFPSAIYISALAAGLDKTPIGRNSKVTRGEKAQISLDKTFADSLS